MLSEDSEDEEDVHNDGENESIVQRTGFAEVAIQDNECFAALAMQMERIEILSKIWLSAMQIGMRTDADETLLDVLRHEMKLTLQDKMYEKCVKTLAMRMLSRSDKNLKKFED